MGGLQVFVPRGELPLLATRYSLRPKLVDVDLSKYGCINILKCVYIHPYFNKSASTNLGQRE
jgi:hypothetical protein